MPKFYVTKAVYLSLEVEAELEEDAVKIAQDIDYTEWDVDDEDEPVAETDVDPIENPEYYRQG